MTAYIDDNLEGIYRRLMQDVGIFGPYESSPRGKPIREKLAASFTLTDPRSRLITSPARNVNYGFAVGELCWYVRGDQDLATMLYYNKRMGQFSDDGKTINSAYGHRMFKDRWTEAGWLDVSQLDNVIVELKKDPDSRRAVMHINEPSDLRRAVRVGSKDVPCTMSIQLLIRDRRLHMHVLMRSNDLVWGVPYDVFSFTCLQEAFLYMLQEAGVPVDELGHYHHTAGSLHVYDTHWDMALDVSKEEHPPPPPMKPFTLAELHELAERDEPLVRGGQPWIAAGGETYTWMLSQLSAHRQKRDDEAAAEKARQREALDELMRLTEEAGGYDELKEKDVQQT